MEVKPGYKQTEVGVIPEEWEVAELSAVTTQIGDGLHGTPLYSPNGNYFFINGNNLGDGRIVFTNETQSVGRAEFIKHRKPLGDRSILMSINGTIGNLALFNDEPVMLGKSVAFLNVSPRVSKNFIYHSLRAPKVKQQFFGGLTGSTIGNLGLATIRGTKIPLPPSEDEQRTIAAALSDADGLLGGLDRLIAKKRDLKQAAMQQLLTGQTRLPGFHGDWESVRIGDAADPNQCWSFTGGPFGSNLKSSDYTESGVRIIQLQNIGDGEFKDGYAIYTSDAKADELVSCNIYPGEIILSKMGDPVARACIIPSLHDRYLMCSDGIRLVVDSSRFATNFVFAQINAPDFRTRAANAGTGSTRKRIGLTELRNLELQCPPTKDEQTAIAKVLTDMDVELSALEQRREKTRYLKQAMMQELLTGRTRLI